MFLLTTEATCIQQCLSVSAQLEDHPNSQTQRVGTEDRDHIISHSPNLECMPPPLSGENTEQAAR